MPGTANLLDFSRRKLLQGVSFEVAAGEKVGIVGRTGSGKSSLIVTLFRIVEPDGGVISLDGLDLGSLGLNDVRGRIAAIPQDPVLFSGTVRSNLDPYGRHEDHELWEALGHVALKVPHQLCPLHAPHLQAYWARVHESRARCVLLSFSRCGSGTQQVLHAD